MATGPEGDRPASVSVSVPAASGPGAGRSALDRVLRYFALALKLMLFALVFAFAVKNSEPVVLKFFLGRELSISLALALVGALCTGAVLGVLAMAAYALRLRREATQARRDAEAARQTLAASRAQATSVLPADTPVGARPASVTSGQEWPLHHGL